jgi:dihydrofolate synthase/folylpolyglutamate synthase
MHDYLLSLEHLGIKLGLEQIRALVERLGRPDRAYRSITVAGTNGKGSVTAMVERGLRAAGYRTGRYTSPHLVDLEERMALDGQPISAAEFVAAAELVREAAAHLRAPPSFFEATTAVALEAFRRGHVELAVLEVGLGGRLDATNVVSPMGAAITAIDFDHEEYLGETLEAIAREKAGVIKPGMFLVLGENPPDVRRLMKATCDEAGAAFVFARDGVGVEAGVVDGRTRLSLRTPLAHYDDLTLSLRGRHQIDNAVTAARLLEELHVRQHCHVPAAAIRTALTDVEWPGRLELRRWHGHDVLVDGAHNPAGARALAAYLQETYGRPLPLVLGAMRDKKIDRIVDALSGAASCFVCTSPNTPRAASPADLVAIVRRITPGVEAIEAMRPLDALARAASRGAPVVVCGSLYLAGDIRAELS